MRILTKSGERSKSFKLKDVVAMQIGKMQSVKDARTMEPSTDGHDLAVKCLDTVNKFFGNGKDFKKETMREPTFKNWKASCKKQWHLLKAKNPYLRSYNFDQKGWLLLKVDADTPKAALDKIAIQSKDRIRIFVEKHNERINHDGKMIGFRPSGYLE